MLATSNPVLASGHAAADRRRRRRATVDWPVLLYDDAGAPVQTATRNLSSEGLYCTVPSLLAGIARTCVIQVPPAGPEPPVALECRIRVLRIEVLPDGGFGMAAHIEEYRVRLPEEAVRPPLFPDEFE